MSSATLTIPDFENIEERLEFYEDIKRQVNELPPPPLGFERMARGNQAEPSEGLWVTFWYIRGARGTGKTWSGAGNLAKIIKNAEPLVDPEGAYMPSEWGVVAPTIADTRDTCFEGPSGLIRALGGEASHGKLIKKGPYIEGWNRSMTQLYLKDGGTVFGGTAEDGALRIQGKNLRGGWADEIGLWDKWETAWDESIAYALRLPPAKWIVTGTPKMNQRSRALVKRLLNDPTVAKSWLKLEENRKNLSTAIVEKLLSLKGTRLGRQEAGGELVEDVEGAYFFQTQIDEDRLPQGIEGFKRPKRRHIQWLLELIKTDVVRMVVAVDPAVTSSEDSDETGIIVACLGANGHGYVVEDLSGRYSPNEWAKIAVDAYKRWHADVIVGEANNGGDMVGTTIHTVDADAPYKKITATRGKILRAEPISAAYTQHRVHHVGLPEDYEVLEDQLTNCVPGVEQEHDDHLDADVYALTELGLAGGGMTWEEVYDDGALATATPKSEQGTGEVVGGTGGVSGELGDGESDPDGEPEEDYDPWAETYK